MQQQPQQQQQQMMGSMAPVAISTEQIQKLPFWALPWRPNGSKDFLCFYYLAWNDYFDSLLPHYLEENKQLILAILDNQNLGKLAECAQYQAQLQKNLLYLAAIADSQPPAAIRPQMMMPHAGMQQGGVPLMQQAPIFRPQAPLQFNPQQVQEQQVHHQPQMMPFQGHMGMRHMGVMNSMHTPIHAEPTHGGGSNDVPPGSQNLAELSRGSTPSSSVDGRESKQDAGGAASEPPAAVDGQKNLAMENASGEVDLSGNAKRPEGAKTP